MIVTKLLLVCYLVLVNRQLASTVYLNYSVRALWLSSLRYREPKCLYGGINMGFHNLELKHVLDVKYKNEFTFIKHNKRTKVRNQFDARKRWRKCTSISQIKNQNDCTISWAIAPAMVTTDRSCIASRGKKLLNISEQNLIKCCHHCHPNYSPGHTCHYRSNLIVAFFFMKEFGVTNGDCNAFDIKRLNVVCDRKSCDRKEVPHRRHKIFKVSIGTSKRSTVKDMQIEIQKNGPIVSMLRVIPRDFRNYYTNQVYINNGKNLMEDSAHAVRIVGWGRQGGVPYWLCANSWGTEWGKLKGFFKIRLGTNELGIEEFFIAPDLHVGREKLTDGLIFNPTGEIENGISCIKPTHFYKIIVIIVLIIFSL